MHSITDITFALAEYDCALMARGLGSCGNAHVLSSTIMRLPSIERDSVRAALQAAIDAAVSRTESRLRELGIDPSISQNTRFHVKYMGDTSPAS